MTSILRHSLAALAFASAVWSAATPAAAAGDLETCREASGDQAIATCTRVIDSGRYGGPELRHLRAYAARLCTTIETLAVAAALSQPWADVVLSGAVTCDQLQEHVAALAIGTERVPPLPIAEPSNLYWRRRATLAWS